ncbi:MAG TPA: hypothetical protein DEX20_05300 [Halieaceae bacterium]|nr:hypothetical protein [Halieaceae bacterium]
MSTNKVVSTGESDLLTLIAQMSPSLDDQVWAFVSVGEVSSEYVEEHALATFRETEGTTLIVPWVRAEEFHVCSEPMARITLNIHSSLEAVGLTAAVSQALASEAISANVVAGFYHDHIFVPQTAGERAVACLTLLSAAAEGI